MAAKQSRSKRSTSSVGARSVSKTKKSSSAVQTMDELLAQTDYKFKALSRGQIVEGVITAILPQAVYIDVGAKSEGVVSGKEYDLVKEFIATLSVGDKVPVYVRNPEDDQGNVVLSLRKAATDSIWQKMTALFESKGSIEVRGIDVNKGGVIVNVQGLQGFIPSSQLLPEHLGRERSLINTKIIARVIEVTRSQNRLVLAETRELTPKEEEQRLKAWQKIKVGGTVKGKVVSLITPGAIIKINDALEAFLPLSEVAWEKVDNLEAFLAVGQEIKSKVIAKDENQDRIIVSLKQLGKDPWETVKAKYREGQEVAGTITKKVAYGFFVELEPGVEGLIHVSKLAGDLKLAVGDEVKCFVENVEPENRRIGLSVVPKEVPVIYK